MDKYTLTQAGYDEFVQNKTRYIRPNVRAKLMSTLSSRVGYPLDSLVAQVKLDPRIKARDGEVMGEILRLCGEGYVEVRNIG